jgi:hypothetical protein
LVSMKTLLLVVVVLSATAACVQKSKRLTGAEREAAVQIASRTAPKPSHALDIRFENKIRLLGYDTSAEVIHDGDTFTVTWYWQVEQALGEGWNVFTHLADAGKNNRLNLDSMRPFRTLYPEAKWKAGEYIRDVQEITLPSDWHSNAALFYLGFWNGPHRLHVTVGPNDGDNRALALTLPVEPRADPHALPRIVARRVSGTLTLDGKLDEPDWKMAQPSGPFVQTMTGQKGSFAASARVLYDADNLYIGYDVADDYLKCTFTKNDEHLWEQDVVELMVDPEGDAKNYFELQASPTGLTFDTRYDSRRLPRPFGDMAWSSGAVPKIALRGKPNDDSNDDGYSVEFVIPWHAFAAGSTPAEPPKAGDVWRMNFFVMDARESGQRAVGWSPPLIGDFHTLDRFGRVVFPQAAIAPSTAAPTNAAPTAPK